MKLENVHDFFFHPLSEKLPPKLQALSMITVVALSIFTAFGFLVVFGIVNWVDRKISQKDSKDDKVLHIIKSFIQESNANKQIPSPPLIENRTQQKVVKSNPTENSKLNPASLKKINKIKKVNAKQVNSFKKWADKKDWKKFKPEYSHYDWWAFPIMRSSSGYGEKFAVTPEEIEILKTDSEFMHNYRLGVELVVKSWGWDLNNNIPIHSHEKTKAQAWTGFDVRLGKMADSLRLFDQNDLYTKLQTFFDQVCVPKANKYPLENWVYKNLDREPPPPE